MSSRFVPAGTDQSPPPKDDDWERAREQVQNKRNEKPVGPGKQEGGKSLYEVLQANKAAKQEAFEEAAKVRNQFRALDDSEVEFLESIRDSERAKEDSVRRETAEQLDQFRKQQTAADKPVTYPEQGTTYSEQKPTTKSWTAPKKRRREQVDDAATTKAFQKSAKASGNDSNQVIVVNVENNYHAASTRNSKENVETTRDEQSGSKKKEQTSGLGLSAYDSDDE